MRIAALIGVMATLGCTTAKPRPDRRLDFGFRAFQISKATVPGEPIAFRVLVVYQGESPIETYTRATQYLKLLTTPPGWKKSEEKLYFNILGVGPLTTELRKGQTIEADHGIQAHYTKWCAGTNTIPIELPIWDAKDLSRRAKPLAVLRGNLLLITK